MRQVKCAGGVVVNPKGEVIVVKKINQSWSLPKGHIEKSEDVLEAAEREVYEEARVTELTFVKELGTYCRFHIGPDEPGNRSEYKCITMFLFKTIQLVLKPVDKKHPEARWVAPDQVARLLTNQKDKEFFESILPEVKNI